LICVSLYQIQSNGILLNTYLKRIFIMAYEISISKTWAAAIAPSIKGTSADDLRVYLFTKQAVGWKQHSIVSVSIGNSCRKEDSCLNFVNGKLLITSKAGDGTEMLLGMFGFDGSRWIEELLMEEEVATPQTPVIEHIFRAERNLTYATALVNPFSGFRKRMAGVYNFLLSGLF
jgi:hypothetical protein